MFVFGNFVNAAAIILYYILEFAMWVIIIRALISWVSPDPNNPIVLFLVQVTNPILRPIQRRIPPLGGMDLSPIIAIFLILFLKLFVVSTLKGIAMRMGAGPLGL